MDFQLEAYHLHKQYTDFPDSFYYWVYPKVKNLNKDVLFVTNYVQNEIWKHQFSATCEDKIFLIVPLISTGMDHFLLF